MPWGKVEIFFHSIYRRWLCVIHKVPTPPNLFLKYLYSNKTNEEWVTEVQRQMVSGKQSYGTYLKAFCLCWALMQSHPRQPYRFQCGPHCCACPAFPASRMFPGRLTCCSLLWSAFPSKHLLGNHFKSTQCRYLLGRKLSMQRIKVVHWWDWSYFE